MAPSLIDRTRRWFRTHLVIPLKQMSWHERLVLVALGFWFGIFPIPGLSTPILLFGFLVVNALVAKQLTMPETTVATAVNILATPFCLALMPLWMALGGYIFGLGARCEASQIIDELYVQYPMHNFCISRVVLLQDSSRRYLNLPHVWGPHLSHG